MRTFLFGVASSILAIWMFDNDVLGIREQNETATHRECATSAAISPIAEKISIRKQGL